jgi:hypothetical protein
MNLLNIFLVIPGRYPSDKGKLLKNIMDVLMEYEGYHELKHEWIRRHRHGYNIPLPRS